MFPPLWTVVAQGEVRPNRASEFLGNFGFQPQCIPKIDRTTSVSFLFSSGGCLNHREGN